MFPASWPIASTSSDPWAGVNLASAVTMAARTPVINSPAIVPVIAAVVVRDRPWVSTNERIVTVTPSPIARTSGFQPASRSGISTRIARTSDSPRATRERRPRQPATAMVTSANSRASPPIRGRRQRSITENEVVPSCCVSIATTTSSPTP